MAVVAVVAALRAELGIPDAFPPQVQAEAERAAKTPPALPSYDATDIPFFTLDPPAATDLDQATHLARQSTGYRVRYAIADVAVFVVPGGALDTEAHRRVNTLHTAWSSWRSTAGFRADADLDAAWKRGLKALHRQGRGGAA